MAYENVFDFNSAPKQGPIKPRIDKDPITAFREFLFGHGYSAGDIIADGEIKRFKSPEDKNGKKSAYYVMYDDYPQAGMLGDFKTDVSHTWCIKSETDLTDEETYHYRQRIDKAKDKRNQDREKQNASARVKAQKAWSEAEPVTEHPYLQKKGISAIGGIKMLRGNLIFPLMDHSGIIHSFQTISATGDKRFCYGGAKKGHYFSIPGSPTIAICEGYATAVSIHLATGWTTVVAVDAGNLEPVAIEWRKNSPTVEIIICADNDVTNVGQNKAKKAAESVSASIRIPSISGSDFNDVHSSEGLDALKQELIVLPSNYRTTVTDWGLEKYDGPAPERTWLVHNTIPSATLTILSAQGDAGKGMMLLDLGLKVAGNPSDNDLSPIEAFGNKIESHGAVVIITAEDDKDEMHRRISGIRNGREIVHPLYIVPLPNAGGPMPLVTSGRSGPETSPLWHEAKTQLLAIPSLQLVVIDPLASFIMADVNADPAVGAFTTGLFASLATETGATVLVAHHLAKTKTKITGPEDARSLVRGSTAIVDGARSVYVLWGADERTSKQKCKHLSIEWQRNRIFYGCLVKSNGPGDRDIKTYARNESGLLQPVDVKIRQAASEDVGIILDMLEDDIRFLAASYYPISKTGANGVWEQKAYLHPLLRELTQRQLRNYVERLKDQNRVVAVAPKGSKSRSYLDVPRGPFTSEDTEILTGEAPKRW